MTHELEAAARAAYEACREWGGADQPWEEISPFQSDVCTDHWRAIARAAIAVVLLEPSEELCTAVLKAMNDHTWRNREVWVLASAGRHILGDAP